MSRTVVKKIPVGSVPIQVYATPDNRLLFVANQGSKGMPGRTVSVIDLARLEVVKTVETGPGAHGVVVAPDGRHVFVTNTYGNTVSVIEVASLKVVATVPVGRGPNGISTTP
jgi:YVTN family beta-propeller protein